MDTFWISVQIYQNPQICTPTHTHTHIYIYIHTHTHTYEAPYSFCECRPLRQLIRLRAENFFTWTLINDLALHPTLFSTSVGSTASLTSVPAVCSKVLEDSPSWYPSDEICTFSIAAGVSSWKYYVASWRHMGDWKYGSVNSLSQH